jgi:hypothetical protein
MTYRGCKERRRFDKSDPVPSERNPETSANRLLGEAFRIANGSTTLPPRAHLCELLVFARAYVEIAQGDGIERDALAKGCEHLAERNAELEAALGRVRGIVRSSLKEVA